MPVYPNNLTVHNCDVYVNGAFSAQSMTVAASSVTDNSVTASAGIRATKLQQQRTSVHGQGGAAASETRVVHVGKPNGQVVAFQAGARAPAGGSTTVTVDLYKNGSTVLSAPVSLTSAAPAYTASPATVTAPAFAAGDVLEVVIAVAGANPPQGLYAVLTVREDPQ